MKKSEAEKAINEVLSELSPEVRDRALKAMQDRGHTERARNWEKYFSTKDLEKFKGKPIFGKLEISNFDIETARKTGDKLIRIDYRTPPEVRYNRTYGKITYSPAADEFYGVPGNISRKTARILGQIAKEVNPDTKYKQGTGDFKIFGY